MNSMKEVRLLSIFARQVRNTPIRSLKISHIVRLCNENEKTMMSESTVRRGLAKLISQEYVACGIKHSNEKTYYITERGSNFLDEIKGYVETKDGTKRKNIDILEEDLEYEE